MLKPRILRRRLSLSVVVPVTIAVIALLVGTVFWLASRESDAAVGQTTAEPMPQTGRLCYRGRLENNEEIEVHGFADLTESQARLSVMYDRDSNEVLVARGELVETGPEFVYALEGTVVAASEPESTIVVRFSLASNALYLPGNDSLAAITCDDIGSEIAILETVTTGVLPLD